ncbi:MAG: hypothetical protein HY744_01430 [Deltaproteobacteria bacterium]|nr:hypothetical protein [Deltaproteobacteria bacterium]
MSAGESRAVELRLGGAAGEPAAAAAPAGEGGPSWAVLGTGIGVTVVGVAAGAVLVVVANGKARDAEGIDGQLTQKGATGPARCNPPPAGTETLCADLADADQGRTTFTLASGVAFGVAGATAIATGIYAIVSAAASGEKQQTARLVPVVGLREQRLVLQVDF